MALKKKKAFWLDYGISGIGCFVCARGKKIVLWINLLEDNGRCNLPREEIKSAEKEAAEQWEKGLRPSVRMNRKGKKLRPTVKADKPLDLDI